MWPFRKKPKFDAGAFADTQLANLNNTLMQQQADMQRRLNAEVARLAAVPMPRIVWTPVMNVYGQIVALAWKNNAETALRLLEGPAEGSA